ncbi:MAG: CaiB/BaiF CoA-transferase family protein [Myxococcota bacterium]
MTHEAPPPGPLAGLRILDLSRILAGPTCTQLLGDLGADVLKVERPGEGDDTRKWGPPYVQDAAGADTSESAYYLCANRNKRSLAIDFRTPDGAALVRRLAAESDVLIENLKVGSLAKHGLGYADLAPTHPRLVYCSITGFGQTGPRKDQPGYDFLVQAMGGIMSLSGEPEGQPMKTGVGIADVMCGMYATVGILAALRHRDRAGEGQHLDVALFDAQVSWLINGALNYLTSGALPIRRGNGHPNIVPYQVFGSADGHVVIAAGNDAQFGRLCEVAGVAGLAADPRFATNAARVRNRDALLPLLEERTRTKTTDAWIAALEAAKVPCGPVNTLDRVFADPQTQHRGMRITMPHPLAGSGEVALLGNPLNLSATPVSYRRPPPVRAAHTREVLEEVLGMGAPELEALAAAGAIEAL